MSESSAKAKLRSLADAALAEIDRASGPIERFRGVAFANMGRDGIFERLKPFGEAVEETASIPLLVERFGLAEARRVVLQFFYQFFEPGRFHVQAFYGCASRRLTLSQWERLLCFLDNVHIPVDNNASESALRVVALGRKNFLFVGDVETGDHLATLYSLVSSCEASDIDPVEYLKDVLLRIDTHPASRIDELLPHKWSPPLRWTES